MASNPAATRQILVLGLLQHRRQTRMVPTSSPLANDGFLRLSDTLSPANDQTNLNHTYTNSISTTRMCTLARSPPRSPGPSLEDLWDATDVFSWRNAQQGRSRDLFVFNDTTEGPKVLGRFVVAWLLFRLLILVLGSKCVPNERRQTDHGGGGEVATLT